MRIFLGIDGGGTGSRAQAELETGQKTAVFQGGPANIYAAPMQALPAIRHLLKQTIAAAQALSPDIDNTKICICMGLAGASETEAAQHIRTALRYPNSLILGDIDITLKGALHDEDGIVMAIGTGSVLARQTQQRMQRIGGYGFLLGDEASGAWIGAQAIRKTLHTRDTLLPPSPIAEYISSLYPEVSQLLAFASKAQPADYAAFAPKIFECEQLDCPTSAAILDEACVYLDRAVRCLQDGQSDLAVTATGGLGSLLLQRLQRTLCPDLHYITPKGNALDGALWCAKQMHNHTTHLDQDKS